MSLSQKTVRVTLADIDEDPTFRNALKVMNQARTLCKPALHTMICYAFLSAMRPIHAAGQKATYREILVECDIPETSKQKVRRTLCVTQSRNVAEAEVLYDSLSAFI